MSLIMNYKGNPPYEIDKLWVATNNWDGTFGGMVEVLGANMFVHAARMKVVEGVANRRIAARTSKVLAVPITLRSLAIPVAGYEVIMNQTSASYGTTPDRYNQLELGAGDETGFFGVIARIPAANSTGGILYFAPFVTVTQDIEWRFDGDNYVSSEFRCEAIGDPVLTKAGGAPLLERWREYESSLPTPTSMPFP
jgi:hypothetical protein